MRDKWSQWLCALAEGKRCLRYRNFSQRKKNVNSQIKKDGWKEANSKEEKNINFIKTIKFLSMSLTKYHNACILKKDIIGYFRTIPEIVVIYLSAPPSHCVCTHKIDWFLALNTNLMTKINNSIYWTHWRVCEQKKITTLS